MRIEELTKPFFQAEMFIVRMLMMIVNIMVFMVKMKREIENDELTRPFFQAEMLRRMEDCVNDKVKIHMS